MPRVSCQICNEEFYVKPNRLEKGWGKYCSNACKHTGLKTGDSVQCTQCEKTIYRGTSEKRRSTSGNYFCNRSCLATWRNLRRIGDQHVNWRGGESSYRSILLRSTHKRTCRKCDSEDIRILAVHHKDRNRQNNDISNLIWLCHNCHYLVHHFENEADGFLTA